MGRETSIEWCDSSGNIEMGCDGCELWTDKLCLRCGKPIQSLDGATFQHKDGSTDHEAKPVHICYAGILHERHAGRNHSGYPMAFNKPALFLDRLLAMQTWRDLTGQKRPDKPWLDGLPRCIFLNDMGDTFTASLPRNWLAQREDILGGKSPLEILASLQAIIMLPTKRPDLMWQFFEEHPCPDNFIPMTSITGPETLNRLRYLLKIKARWHGVSAEPLLKRTILGPYLEKLSWVITGARSGGSERGDYDLLAFRELRDVCHGLGLPFFMKQLDKKDPIPPDLMVRQMPNFTLPDKKGTPSLWPNTP